MADANVKKPLSKKEELAELIAKYLLLKGEIKLKYAESDAIFAEIRKKLKPGRYITLECGIKAHLVDAFAGKDTVWKATPIKRWDVEISEP